VSPTLRILACPAAELVGRSFPVGREGCAIGRDSANDLVLPDDAASRRHARLQPTSDGGWEIVDNESGNGVWLADRRVTRQRLEDGDVVRIGNTQLQLLLAPASAAAAATLIAPAGVVSARLCPGCHATVAGGARFCPQCGEAMATGAPPPPAPTVAPPSPQLPAPPPPPPPPPPLPVPPPPPPPPPLPVPPPASAPPAPPPAGASQGAPGHRPTHPQPGYPPYGGAPTAAAAPRKGGTGCAIGCCLLAFVLFVVAAAGTVYVLYRSGDLRLPGSAAVSEPG
jgi:hypothetical protein